MIKCGKLKGNEDEEAIEQCILYTKDGSKALGYFPYSKHGGEEGAKAAAEKREKQVQFFKQKHQGLLDAVDAFGAPVVLKYLLDKSADCEACQEVIKAFVEKGQDVEKAEKKRPSFKEVWESDYGGSVTECMKIVAQKVSDPGAYCAWLKDHVTGTTHWRGKEEKSFTETAEEALTMLEKDEKDIDLSELERWLEGKADKVQDTAPPAADAEPEPVPEPEPAPVEELPNDFRTFLLRDHAQRQAAVMALVGEEVTDGQDH